MRYGTIDAAHRWCYDLSMTYQQAIKIYWREGSPQRLWSKAHTILARKCRMYGDKARRHTLWCCLMAEH